MPRTSSTSPTAPPITPPAPLRPRSRQAIELSRSDPKTAHRWNDLLPDTFLLLRCRRCAIHAAHWRQGLLQKFSPSRRAKIQAVYKITCTVCGREQKNECDFRLFELGAPDWRTQSGR